jgi:hypothetical protein
MGLLVGAFVDEAYMEIVTKELLSLQLKVCKLSRLTTKDLSLLVDKCKR